jgi:hypothetical protein
MPTLCRVLPAHQTLTDAQQLPSGGMHQVNRISARRWTPHCPTRAAEVEAGNAMGSSMLTSRRPQSSPRRANIPGVDPPRTQAVLGRPSELGSSANFGAARGGS